MPKFSFLSRNKSGKSKDESINTLLSMAPQRSPARVPHQSSQPTPSSAHSHRSSASSSLSRARSESAYSTDSYATDSLPRQSLATTFAASHSHRNLKPSQQILLAEAMYDPKEPLNLKSRLALTFDDAINDKALNASFVNYCCVEAQGNQGQCLIQLWNEIRSLLAALEIECEELALTQSAKAELSSRIVERYEHLAAVDRLRLPDKLSQELKATLASTSVISKKLLLETERSLRPHLELHYDAYLKSPFFSNYKVNLFTSADVRLSDVLFYDLSFFYFIEFMEQEAMRNYVDFIVVAKAMQAVQTEFDDFQSVYSTYFTPESPKCLLFSDGLRQELEVGAKRNGKVQHSFDKPLAILLQYFEKTYFKQFLESEAYLRFLNDVISSYQNEQQSDARSEASTSQYSIDSKQDKSDASQAGDLLWKRAKAGRLHNIAHVDQYGKLISELEPEPDKPAASTGLFKKLMSKSTNEKTQEAMAWHVAEMIVNDICKITSEDWS